MRACLSCYVCFAVAGAVRAVVVCLVAGMVAVVAIELSDAVGVAGGESVRDMFVLRGWRVRSSCGRCTRRSSLLPHGWKLPLHVWFLLLLLSSLLLLLLMDHLGLGVSRVCFSGPESGDCGP